jgi:aminoglycoside phosphotransferase (APT) family kinase protein
MGSVPRVTSTQGADPAVVGPYLAEALDDAAWSSPDVTLIAGGKSNLTYRIDSPAGSVVLRRPPLGHVLPTAHDMGREFRVMSALGGTAVPVPRMRHFCDDASVLGQPFYVMDLVEGHVVRSEFPAGYADSEPERRQVCERLVDTLGALHRVDPVSVGLGDFGRPEGYLARQVARWRKQWDATRIEGLSSVDALASELAASLPATQRHTVVHGDYRLDNTVLDPDDAGRVVAVLDWEMSTLGDPLADLGVLLVYWNQADDEGARKGGLVVPTVTSLPGMLTRDEVAARYATASGLDLAPLPWYVAFGFFKLAVVCAGIAARSKGGAMVGDGFEGFDAVVPTLVELGQSTLSERTLG